MSKMLKKLLVFAIFISVAVFFFLRKTGDSSHKNVETARAPKAQRNASTKKVKPKQSVSQTETAEKTLFSEVTSEKEFLDQFPGEWKFRKNELGKIHSITGDLIPNVTGSPDRVVALVKALAPIFAEGDFSIDNTANRVSNTDYIRSFQVNQSVNGRPVYQGSATVLGRNSDNSAYIVNNRLKDIFGVADQPLIDIVEAKNIAKENFGEQKSDDLTLVPVDEVVVFSDDERHSELAWVIRYSRGNKSGEVVIGAETGRVLHEQTHTRVN